MNPAISQLQVNIWSCDLLVDTCRCSSQFLSTCLRYQDKSSKFQNDLNSNSFAKTPVKCPDFIDIGYCYQNATEPCLLWKD